MPCSRPQPRPWTPPWSTAVVPASNPVRPHPPVHGPIVPQRGALQATLDACGCDALPGNPSSWLRCGSSARRPGGRRGQPGSGSESPARRIGETFSGRRRLHPWDPTACCGCGPRGTPDRSEWRHPLPCSSHCLPIRRSGRWRPQYARSDLCWWLISPTCDPSSARSRPSTPWWGRSCCRCSATTGSSGARRRTFRPARPSRKTRPPSWSRCPSWSRRSCGSACSSIDDAWPMSPSRGMTEAVPRWISTAGHALEQWCRASARVLGR